MDKRLSISCMALGAGLVAAGFTPLPRAQVAPSPVACLHDTFERQPDRVRRDQALGVAKAINAAQGALAQQTRRFHALADLRNLPDVPGGFELRFYSDAAGYVFSLKDARDPCHFAIFSDQSGLLYEKAARTAPLAAPL
jgi:hypothetical protein